MYRGVPKALLAFCAALLLAFATTRFSGSGGRVYRGVPKTEEAFISNDVVAFADGALAGIGGGAVCCRGVPKTEDCSCAFVLRADPPDAWPADLGVGGGGCS